ncbi:MAG: 3-dehydroquinate synthase [Propionibacteriaceae bacterium]|jgi:3-dehydroquinate synthase|nr:3-dehydroquinate synthase [Propionibacteriaceae bacterium]
MAEDFATSLSEAAPTAPAADPGTAETTIVVAGPPPYPVCLGPGTRHRLEALAAGVRVAVIHPPALADPAQALLSGREGVVRLAVPDGEAAKTPAVLADCWSALARAGLTRDDLVVGLGGGATTDLAGFVAATYLRGVAYVALPTTVLALADAAVGGKTGLDLPEGKNLAGAFHQPRAVLGDFDLLAGLPVREVVSGLAEIIKCGLLADPAISTVVADRPERVKDTSTAEFAQVLARAVRVKAAVVAQDPFEAVDPRERVGREALNYGHTLAHAIERQTGYAVRHGEAVSLGLVWAAEVARRLGLLSAAEADRHRQLLSAVGLPVAYRDAPWERLRALMGRDKKARGASLRLVLLHGLGRPVVVADPPEAVLAAAYAALA